jgi:hypothetical protein
MPNAQALQVFYGSIPLILVIAGFYATTLQQGRKDNLLLKSILDRLLSIETETKEIRKELGKIRERLTLLETRAGVIFHE